MTAAAPRKPAPSGNGIEWQGWGQRLQLSGPYVVTFFLLGAGLGLLIYVTHKGFDTLDRRYQQTVDPITKVIVDHHRQSQVLEAQHERLSDQFDAALYLLCIESKTCRSIGISPPKALRQMQEGPPFRP